MVSFRFFEAYLGGRRTSLPSFPPRTERYHCPVSFRSYDILISPIIVLIGH